MDVEIAQERVLKYKLIEIRIVLRKQISTIITLIPQLYRLALNTVKTVFITGIITMVIMAITRI